MNGIELYHASMGTGAPMVWAHGFACGIRSWDPQVREFPAAWRVIASDVRGHGRSDAPAEAEGYSQPISVADLRGLLEHLGIRPGVGAVRRRGTLAAARSCIAGVHANSFPKEDPT
jgi:pimeloyl-ACP methyl ester carboxylesterase